MCEEGIRLTADQINLNRAFNKLIGEVRFQATLFAGIVFLTGGQVVLGLNGDKFIGSVLSVTAIIVIIVALSTVIFLVPAPLPVENERTVSEPAPSSGK